MTDVEKDATLIWTQKTKKTFLFIYSISGVGQPGLQNRTSKLPFISINTDNKQRGRRKDIVQVTTTETTSQRHGGDENASSVTYFICLGSSEETDV